MQLNEIKMFLVIALFLLGVALVVVNAMLVAKRNRLVRYNNGDTTNSGTWIGIFMIFVSFILMSAGVFQGYW
jgi:uncharacterized membrane protein YhaH (DUF805 family)